MTYVPRSRIEVYDRKGSKLGELSTATARSWILNRYGQCEIAMPMSGNTFNSKMLLDGNLIVVHGESIPDWFGVMTNFRKWTRDGICVLTCYSPEWMLNYRIVGYRYLAASSGGGYTYTSQAFTYLIRAASSPAWSGQPSDPLPIFIGSVPQYGEIVTGYTPGLNQTLYDALSGLMNLSAMKYTFTLSPDLDGHPKFAANLYQSVGISVSTPLEEGLNCDLPPSVILQEQGNISNYVFGFTPDSTGALSVAAYKGDDVSRSIYGLRESSLVIQSGVNPLPLIFGVLKIRKNPVRSWTLNVNNKNGIFPRLQLGNTIPLITHSMPFGLNGLRGGTQTVQITGMSYSDAKPEMLLTAEEVLL